MNRFINRHFGKVIYLLYFLCELFVLKQGMGEGLFPPPAAGTDQLSTLQGVGSVFAGNLPGISYHYSFSYTAFLSIAALVARENLIAMRILQAAVCALIPVVVYRTARLMRLGKHVGQISAFLYFFYAPALLISLDFLRAGPLALTFSLTVYFIALGCWTGKNRWFAFAGIFGALCVLGRETFLFVGMVPLLFCLFPKIRKSLSKKASAVYTAALLIPVLGVVVFHFVVYGTLRINIPLDNIDGVGEGTGNIFVLYMRHLSSRFFDFVSSYELPNSLSVYAHQEMIPFLGMFLVPFNVLVALWLIGLWYNRTNRLFLLTTGMVCVFVGTMMHFEIFYRYRIPVVPLIAILAGAGIMALYRWWRRREYWRLTLSLLFMTVFIAMTWVNPDSRRTFNERAAVSRLLIENKHYAKAEDYLWRMAGDGYAKQIRPGVILLVQRLLADGEKARAEEVAGRFNRVLP